MYTCTIASNIQFFSFMKTISNIGRFGISDPHWHHLPNWEILLEFIVKPNTAPTYPPWAKRISQMGETNATIYIILHQIPLTEPNNEWKTGNCIWKVMIRSKMWSKFTEHPVKAFAINLQAQVLIRTIPYNLRLVISLGWSLVCKYLQGPRSASESLCTVNILQIMVG